MSSRSEGHSLRLGYRYPDNRPRFEIPRPPAIRGSVVTVFHDLTLVLGQSLQAFPVIFSILNRFESRFYSWNSAGPRHNDIKVGK